MKTKTSIYILYLLLSFLSCKKDNNTIKVNEEKNKVKLIDSVNKTQTQNDIYINNKWNGMTELVDVKSLKFQETSIDSIWYGLYNVRNTELYIFSVDKFLENPDVEQYRTIDTVNLKSKNIEVTVDDFSNYKTLNLLLDKKLIKKWKFKAYPKKIQEVINLNEGNISKSIFNSWQNDGIEIHINSNNVSYLFHGQCVYSFSVKVLNDNEVELIWGYKGRDCVYDVLFDETFGLPKDKIPQNGKPFSKYTLENDILKVTYYYNDWLNMYRKKMEENDKPYPFLNSFSIKTE